MMAFDSPLPSPAPRLRLTRETKRRWGVWDQYGRFHGRLHRDGPGWRLDGADGATQARTIGPCNHRQAFDWALDFLLRAAFSREAARAG